MKFRKRNQCSQSDRILLCLLLTWLDDDDAVAGEGLEADLVAGVVDAEARVEELLPEEHGAPLEGVVARHHVLQVHEGGQFF